MEEKYNNPMHRLIDRKGWKHSWHMKGRFGRVDWYDKDNLEVVKREIYAARETAAVLERLATEAEESMKEHMPSHEPDQNENNEGIPDCPSCGGWQFHMRSGAWRCCRCGWTAEQSTPPNVCNQAPRGCVRAPPEGSLDCLVECAGQNASLCLVVLA